MEYNLKSYAFITAFSGGLGALYGHLSHMSVPFCATAFAVSAIAKLALKQLIQSVGEKRSWSPEKIELIKQISDVFSTTVMATAFVALGIINNLMAAISIGLSLSLLVLSQSQVTNLQGYSTSSS